MAVSEEQDIASLTLAQLRGLRRENVAILEHVARLFENQNRLQSAILSFQDEVRDAFRAIRTDINGLKSDVLLLERHLANRYDEELNSIQQIDEVDFPSPQGAG